MKVKRGGAEVSGNIVKEYSFVHKKSTHTISRDVPTHAGVQTNWYYGKMNGSWPCLVVPVRWGLNVCTRQGRRPQEASGESVQST